MMRKHRLLWSARAAILLLVTAVTAVIGTFTVPAAVTQAADVCREPYNPVFSPADFRDAQGRPNTITNPYFPLTPGTIYVYEGTGKGGETERVEVTVTRQTKTILGVTTTVVRDEVTVNGQLVERTFDWFAQHDDGTVWYFGEDATEFPSLSKAGSWEAGQNGAKPGIIMQAHPLVGASYRQEFAPGVAEDAAEVRRLDREVSVPYGSFDDVLQTRDFTCLEPGSEDKYYAPGVGLVLEVGRGNERLALITVR